MGWTEGTGEGGNVIGKPDGVTDGTCKQTGDALQRFAELKFDFELTRLGKGVGDAVGERLGLTLGTLLGAGEGEIVGGFVRGRTGALLGAGEGEIVGTSVGAGTGAPLGIGEGEIVGVIVGGGGGGGGGTVGAAVGGDCRHVKLRTLISNNKVRGGVKQTQNRTFGA